MLLEEIYKISKIFEALIKEKNIKIVSHLDADGLTSASIIAKMLLRKNVNFELRIVKQLVSGMVKDLQIDENDILILTDCGSGQLNLLKKIVEKTQILILDHHEPQKISNLNLFHLNPLLFGEEEISSSILCYLFAKAVDVKNMDLIDLAIVGAVGDELDEKWEFTGFARKILKEAEDIGKVTILKGLRLYGRSTRPVHKALEHSFDPFIPGVSGSESAAVQFLSELGIEIKNDDEWKKLKDLTIDEQKKLASAIIIERLRVKHPEVTDIFGEIYLLSGLPEEIQDAREFATLLNACGRLGKYETAIELCLNDLTAIGDVDEILNEYRRKISEGMEWIRGNDVIKATDNATYIFCEDKVLDTIIGTLTSIFLNSNLIDSGKPVFGFAESDGKIKVSARASKDLKQINLKEIIVYAIEQLQAEGGGHEFAAGALISKEDKDKFVKIVDKKTGETIGSKKG